MAFYQVTFFVVICLVVETYFKFYGKDIDLGPYFGWLVIVDIVMGIGIFVWTLVDEIKKVKKH